MQTNSLSLKALESPRRKEIADRYIPNSIHKNLFYLPKRNRVEAIEFEGINGGDLKSELRKEKYKSLYENHVILGHNTMQPSSRRESILKFQNNTKTSDSSVLFDETFVERRKSFSLFQSPTEANQSTRTFPSKPYKILDIPKVQDDFYLNLLDWSSDNLISIALDNAIFIWNASSNRAQRCLELENDNLPSSVSWSNRDKYLAIGDSQGAIRILDIEKKKVVKTMDLHSSRIGCLSWNGSSISSGSRDKKIFHSDIRDKSNYVFKLSGHKQEVCGLKWSFDDQLLASGGNDNKVFIWNLRTQSELTRFSDHTAAIKALCWSPHNHSILASGGGTSDKTIRLWSSSLQKCIKVVDTSSQVCNMIFSKTVEELVSTHGYSMNQITIWNSKKMEAIGNLTGHTNRVIYLAMSPDGQSIVSGAADETLRFWNIFPSAKKIGSSYYNSILANSNEVR